MSAHPTNQADRVLGTRRPMPTVVMADAGHAVRWIDVHPDYSSGAKPAQILGTPGRLGI